MNLAKTRLAIAIVVATAAVAQANDVPVQPSQKSTTLDQVTVSASRVEKKVADTAGSVSVISEEAIDKNLDQTIADLVKYEPGVTVKTDSGRFGASGFNIRGMEGNRVKVMVDGMAISNSYDNGGGFLNAGSDFVDIETLKSVEIVKGPSSTLNGSDAMGGAVAFVTKDPADFLKSEGDDSYASVKSGYSSANEGFTNTLTLANRSDKLESLFIYTRRDAKETETYSDRGGFGDARGKADSQDSAGNNYLGKLQYQLTDTQRLGFTAEYYDTSSDGQLQSKITTLNYDKYDYRDYKDRYRLALDHHWEANNHLFDNVSTSLGWQLSKTKNTTDAHKGNDTTDPADDMARLRKGKYNEESFEYSMVFDKTLETASTFHSLVYGVDLSKTRIETEEYRFDKHVVPNSEDIDGKQRDFPIADEYSYAAFLSDEILLANDRLKVTPGIRYDYRKVKPKIDSLYENTPKPEEIKEESSTFDRVTGQLGAIYSLTDTLSVFAQYAQGFRAPTADEMYYAFDHGFYALKANPDLKAETSNNYEIGIRSQSGFWSAEAAAFYSEYDNFIEQVSSGSVIQNKNLTDTTIKGFEIKAALDLAAISPAADGFTLKGSLAYAEGEYKNKTTGKTPLNSVAPLQSVFGVAYDAPAKNWGGETALTLVSSKDSGDIDNSEAGRDGKGDQYATAGFGLVDMTAYYKPVKDVTLRAGIFNLTDKKYQHWNDVRGLGEDNPGLDRYTQPGRNVSVSVKWEI